MGSIALIPLQALAVVLFADFCAGVVHWAEDTYIDERTPLIGTLIGRPNVIHHHLPRYFTRLSWWRSNRIPLGVAGMIVAGAVLAGVLGWQVWLFAALIANANEFHKWAHRSRRENGRIISLLQDIRILQTPRHHAIHHSDPKNCRYCTTTNLLNPILDRIRFWSRLERLIAALTGLRRRPDTSIHGMGPAPSWIAAYRRNRATGR